MNIFNKYLDDNYRIEFLCHGSCVCIVHFGQHLCDLVDLIGGQNPVQPYRMLFKEEEKKNAQLKINCFSSEKQKEREKQTVNSVNA